MKSLTCWAGFRLQRICVLSFLVLTIAGCGSGSDKWKEGREKVYPVSGKVTLKGAPLQGAVVMFYSESKKLSAVGTTDEGGLYQLKTYEDRDGAVPGEHAVAIRKVQYEKVPSRNSTKEEPATQSIGKEMLPKEYALPGTSPLKETVTEKGPNEFNFEF
ncbi:carboxypeptidase-like regulatory domain-containing protein [Lacunimicrobium album]